MLPVIGRCKGQKEKISALKKRSQRNQSQEPIALLLIVPQKFEEWQEEVKGTGRWFHERIPFYSQRFTSYVCISKNIQTWRAQHFCLDYVRVILSETELFIFQISKKRTTTSTRVQGYQRTSTELEFLFVVIDRRALRRFQDKLQCVIKKYDFVFSDKSSELVFSLS